MAQTLTGPLQLLPNELISSIALLLPLTDVLSLKRATYYLLPVLHRRINPSAYLESVGPFTRSGDLLEAMAAHGAVLSGSRALDYFIPGSATDASDWDFYVPPVLSSVLAVKHALERSSVTFESSLERAVRKLKDEASITLNRKQILSIAYEASFVPRLWSPEQRAVIDAIHNTYPELREITPHIRTDGSIRWMDNLHPIAIRSCGSVSTLQPHEAQSHDYPGHVAARVLWGTAHKNGKTASVHLAQKKAAYRWRVPEAIREKAEAAVHKYADRGFEFETLSNDTRWTIRSAQDADSCFVALGADKQYSPSLSQIKELSWYHKNQSIRLSLQPRTIDAQHELLSFGVGICLRCRVKLLTSSHGAPPLRASSIPLWTLSNYYGTIASGQSDDFEAVDPTHFGDDIKVIYSRHLGEWSYTTSLLFDICHELNKVSEEMRSQQAPESHLRAVEMTARRLFNVAGTTSKLGRWTTGLISTGKLQLGEKSPHQQALNECVEKRGEKRARETPEPTLDPDYDWLLDDCSSDCNDSCDDSCQEGTEKRPLKKMRADLEDCSEVDVSQIGEGSGGQESPEMGTRLSGIL
ncbi:uncharacterized protein VDAG_04852 [Verticillium dahliae VdLs.17]|uniref:Uncharacterized protein n=1 Tax=Verticillium dahliae (strain VdLs.17 / ATCC MYA-4575 / FGSC 10137) TaxID=498257 RepID=G2X367_VERDV|nr:uncharacterized protein VDAG_04852 [Verticillium dahliae VdLs.17]EGY23414.1 hypothetical protein VDAG_04852 [Verticillium dahliae VdLs.17]